MEINKQLRLAIILIRIIFCFINSQTEKSGIYSKKKTGLFHSLNRVIVSCSQVTVTTLSTFRKKKERERK